MGIKVGLSFLITKLEIVSGPGALWFLRLLIWVSMSEVLIANGECRKLGWMLLEGVRLWDMESI